MINISVQYNGEFLPDIILLTQAYYPWGTRLNAMCSGFVFIAYVLCVCFLPVHSGHQVRWTYQPGSHRREVTQDFSSTFFLRCVPQFFSREGFSHSFPSSTVKSNFDFVCVCVCVCVFSSHSFWTSSSLDVPAGVTQEEGHTGFLIHLLSAVLY